MAIDIDWIARLRTAPSEACPEDRDLQAFVKSPESVRPETFAHIVHGCVSCRERLQEIALHPSSEELRLYLAGPEAVPEEVLFHCIDCQPCQLRVRSLLDE